MAPNAAAWVSSTLPLPVSRARAGVAAASRSGSDHTAWCTVTGRPGSRARMAARTPAWYAPAWPADTEPVMSRAVPGAVASWRCAACGRAAPENDASAETTAAVTNTVTAAAASTSRYAFIRRSVMDPRSKRTDPTISGPAPTGPVRAFRKISC